ncbi:MAG: serine/threonine protein kinase [Pseudomonadota bacterium]|nr:serine/threonine protein kinase [Pseudomonadota bacterium]
MSDPAPAPYASLTPDCVLDALESVGLEGDGRLLALNSYENRVYRAHLVDGTVVVVKFYRPGRWSDDAILEEHAFAHELADAEVPVVAPLDLMAPGGAHATLAHHAGFRFAVYPRRSGRAPELDHEGTLAWIGRFIGRMHATGARRPFVHRPSLDVATMGDTSREYLLGSGLLPPDLEPAYRAAVDLAIAGAHRCFARAGAVRTLRLHGDCHVGNILWTAEGPHFVDLDDARSGPAVQDLWMLLSGSRSEMSDQIRAVVQGYRQFYDFDVGELQLIEALRTLRLVHYAAWIAQRWSDPAFPAAFPWFNTQRYWQDRILELREQIASMDEPPLELER